MWVVGGVDMGMMVRWCDDDGVGGRGKHVSYIIPSRLASPRLLPSLTVSYRLVSYALVLSHIVSLRLPPRCLSKARLEHDQKHKPGNPLNIFCFGGFPKFATRPSRRRPASPLIRARPHRDGPFVQLPETSTKNCNRRRSCVVVVKTSRWV